MKPILFSSTATEFATNGLGRLDALSCVVTENRNGEYELTAVLPLGGRHVDEVKDRSIICARPAPSKGIQPFRVYRIGKSIRGLITVYAHHISYDLSGIIVMPYDAKTVKEAFEGLKTYAVSDNPYTFWTDIDKEIELTVKPPMSCRAVIGKVLEKYGGGELEWDNYTVKYHKKRGENRNFVIRYGKNLTSLEQDANCAEVYTGIYPYYYDNSGNYVEVSGQTVAASGSYDYVKILPVDLTDYFTVLDEGKTPEKDTELAYGTIPTQEQLLKVAEQYLVDNDIGVPEVNITVEFCKLSQSEEYKDLALLEDCHLCDEVKVVFPQMDIYATAEVIACKYNVLTDRYNEISLGDAEPDYVAQQEEERLKLINSVEQERANTSKKFAESITALNADVKNLKEQADRNITTWFYDHVPALDNEPASEWSTAADKDTHLGDLFYDTSTGYTYRFMLSGGTYSWSRIVNSDVTKALADASSAYDVADSKRRVFYEVPTPPYDLGDLWVQGEDGDILRCQTAKTIYDEYDEADWILASKYTDDTAVNALATQFAAQITNLSADITNLQAQVDGNITSWFYDYEPTLENAPASEWTADEDKTNHLGDLFYNTSTGYAYRFLMTGTGYEWLRITDSDITLALANAQTAKDVADNKRRVFVTVPSPPYDQGDLWVQGSTGDILRCQTAKAAGKEYAASDWVLSSKYTDDTVAKAAQAAADAAQKTANEALEKATDAYNQLIYINSEISNTPAQSGTLTYTGSAQSPKWNFYNTTALTIGGTTSATNAGTYTATFTPKTGYHWSDGTSAAKSVTWTIGRKAIAVPSQSGTLTYSGAAQSPKWNNYSSSTSTIGGTKSATTAGTYTATFTPTSNYKWSDGTTSAKSVQWYIAKKASTLTLNKSSVTLDLATKSSTVTATVSGTTGAVSVSLSNTNIATASVSGKTITVTAKVYGSVTVTVNVAADTNYNAPTSKTFTVTVDYPQSTLDSNTWAKIKQASNYNVAASYWAVGAQKTITIKGSVQTYTSGSVTYTTYLNLDINAFIIGINHNAGKEGTNRIHFQIGKISNKMVALSSFCIHGSTTKIGWSKTYMRTSVLGCPDDCTPTSPKATTLLAALPSDLRAVMQSVTKYTDNTGYNGAATVTQEYLWLLAEYEIFGKQSLASTSEKNYQAQYAYYSAGNSKVFYQHNATSTAVKTWLRSPYFNSTDKWLIVNTSGSVYVNNKISGNYVLLPIAPCFAV